MVDICSMLLHLQSTMKESKIILCMCHWADIEYPAGINKNNYTLLKKSNPEIALIML